MPAAVVNNVAYDLQNCELEIAGINGSFGLCSMLEELNYSTKITREPMRGSSRNILDFTDGEAEHASSITVGKAYADFFMAKSQETQIGVAMMVLTIGATYSKDGIITQDILWKVRMKGFENAFKRGAAVLIVPIEFDTQNIFYNGFDVFGLPISAAT